MDRSVKMRRIKLLGKCLSVVKTILGKGEEIDPLGADGRFPRLKLRLRWQSIALPCLAACPPNSFHHPCSLHGTGSALCHFF